MQIEMSELVGLLNSLKGDSTKAAEVGGFVTDSSFWKVGNHYFIRTATYHQAGELVSIEGPELIFRKAAWIADSGRFTEAMLTGQFNEVEVWPDDRPVLVNRNAISDASMLPTGSPRSQK